MTESLRSSYKPGVSGAVLAGALLFGAALHAEPDQALKFVVVLARHGVRSPTWTAERLNRYSVEPWPDWGVPPGYLTPHGRELEKIFGAYDREYLVHLGLLSGKCADAGRVYIWADTDQRTMESARALAAGLLPGCASEIHSEPDGKADPLFSPVKAGVAQGDRRRAAAAIMGRIGEHPEALAGAYRSALAALESVLNKPLPEAAFSVEVSKGDHLADLRGPLSTASTLAEDFLLEYSNGMTGKELGWGRLDATNLTEIMSLHCAYADLTRRTRYLARANASNLLSRILASMQQAVRGTSVAGALSKPDNGLLVLLGHDTNITNLAGMLDLSWLLPGYQRDDTPPGGVLVFELWCVPGPGKCSVRTYYMSQTLDQMRAMRRLTLDSPPARARVFIPGCSAGGSDFPCEWEQFDRNAQAAIDPAFVIR